jgi:hypothetical protein
MLPPHNFVPKTSFSFSVDDMVSILGGQSYRLPPLAADAANVHFHRVHMQLLPSRCWNLSPTALTIQIWHGE